MAGHAARGRLVQLPGATASQAWPSRLSGVAPLDTAIPLGATAIRNPAGATIGWQIGHRRRPIRAKPDGPTIDRHVASTMKCVPWFKLHVCERRRGHSGCHHPYGCTAANRPQTSYGTPRRALRIEIALASPLAARPQRPICRLLATVKRIFDCASRNCASDCYFFGRWMTIPSPVRFYPAIMSASIAVKRRRRPRPSRGRHAARRSYFAKALSWSIVPSCQ